MNRFLDFRRFGYVMRKDLFGYWRPTTVVSAAVAASLLVIAFFESLGGLSNGVDYLFFFSTVAVVWGCIAASTAFTELHNKSLNEDFLLLPSSSLEKMLTRLILVSVILPLVILLTVGIGSVVAELLTFLIFKQEFVPFNPFRLEVWKLLGNLVIIQSVFFLGAAWFKKVHLVKTVLTVLLISIVLTILASVMFRLLFSSFFDGFVHPREIGLDVELLIQSRYPELMRRVEIVAKVIHYLVLAPFCWFVAYLRVEETQSSDGV